jgi:hypothetical protein
MSVVHPFCYPSPAAASSAVNGASDLQPARVFRVVISPQHQQHDCIGAGIIYRYMYASLAAAALFHADLGFTCRTIQVSSQPHTS